MTINKKQFINIGLIIILAFSFVISPVMAQEEVTIVDDSSNEEVFVSSTPLQAVAGEDKNVVVGRQVLFSANASSKPVGQEVTYSWDFGDGEFGDGVDAAHIYNNPGIYRVLLSAVSGDQSSTDEIIVAVDKDILLLITDSGVSYESRQNFQSQASTQGILAVDIHDEEGGIDYQVETSLMQLIIDSKEDIRQAASIVIWTERNIGLNALISASQEFDKIDSLENLGFKNKNIILITEKNLSASARLAQNIYTLLTPQAFVLTSPEASEIVATKVDPNDLLNSLNDSQIDYQVIGVHTQRPLTQLKPWNFLSYSVNYMVNNGVSLNTIYLILILPIIATLIAFARQVIGIKAFGIYAPSLVAVSFLATGLAYGLGIFIMVLVVGTLSRYSARKTRILYLPRMAIVLTLVSLSILVLFFFGAMVGKGSLISISIFPILIMVIITEKFVAVQIEKGHQIALRLVAETLILSIVSYSIAYWESFRVLLLGYPELIFLTLILNFILGRWMGLRLLEIYRFRKVLKHVELAEKK